MCTVNNHSFPAPITSFLCLFCSVRLPFVIFGLFIIRTPSSIIVNTKLGIRVFWNQDDSLDVRCASSYSHPQNTQHTATIAQPE